MMHQPRTSLKSGFTIIELLIVIVVIGILAALVIISYNGVQQAARDKVVSSDIETVAAEVSRYSTKNNGALGDAVVWYSGGAANPNIQFTPSPGNVVDIVASATAYCIRAYNPGSNKNDISHAETKGSSATACATLPPSVAAGGTWDSSLVGWWKLNNNADDATGSVAGDLIGSPGPVVGQNGVANNAYSFDGASQGIELDTVGGLASTSSSISCWIYNPTSTNKGTFVKVGWVSQSGGGVGYGIGMGSTDFDTTGNKLVILFEFVRWIPTTATISTGWHHVVMTIDASGVPSAYLDGSLVGSYSGTAAITPTINSYIGTSTSPAFRTFNGSVDDVRLYTKTLSAGDVSALYAAGTQ